MPNNQSVILCTAGYDHTIRFWDATTGSCHRTLQYADSQINALQITPNRQHVAAAGNPQIRLFEVHTSLPTPVMTFEGHTSSVTAVGFQFLVETTLMARIDCKRLSSVTELGWKACRAHAKSVFFLISILSLFSICHDTSAQYAPTTQASSSPHWLVNKKKKRRSSFEKCTYSCPLEIVSIAAASVLI
jgi:hypothetical protein